MNACKPNQSEPMSKLRKLREMLEVQLEVNDLIVEILEKFIASIKRQEGRITAIEDPRQFREKLMNAKILKVGDEVLWAGGFGTHASRIAKVKRIEVTGGERHGISVDAVPWDGIDACVIDLDNGRWAYGYQLERLEPWPIPGTFADSVKRIARGEKLPTRGLNRTPK